ncbi:Transient receptor potential channel pyrexia [Armadillidium vulgare]|nr:Transient receptor potential channel pyrexia [Armadillidium vulgare]
MTEFGGYSKTPLMEKYPQRQRILPLFDNKILKQFNRNESRKPIPQMEQLLKAFTEKDLNAVKALLENGLQINYREPVFAHRTPVFYAAKFDFIEALNELLERGADITSFDDCRVTPLHAAAGHGSLNSLIRLLQIGADPNVKDIHGKTPLHFATRALGGNHEENGFKIVQILLKVGAIPSIKDNEERTPLHEASFVGSTDVLSLLLSGKGASLIYERDKDGRTPLHLAVLGARSLGAVRFLLQFNPPIDAKDHDGRTPLHYVAGRPINYADKDFDVDCLELLLTSGASAQVKDDDGCNALSLALQRTMWWSRQSPRDSVLYSVQLLVAKGSAIIDGFDMWRIVETFPSLVMVALNQSIRVNTSAKDSVHLKLVFDFRPLAVSTRLLAERKRKTTPVAPTEEQLIPSTLLNNNEISMLHYIFSAGHKNILRHPLCSAFLHLKWLRVRKFFFMHVILYFLFVSIFTTYIMNLQDYSSRGVMLLSNNSKNSYFTNEGAEILSNNDGAGILSNTSKNSSNVASGTKVQTDFTENMKSPLWTILMCFTLFFVFKEILQIGHSPSIYIRRYENYIDILILFCVLILLFLPSYRFPITQRNFSTIAVISSWVRLMLFLGEFPSCGVYVVMFSKVCKTVFRFLGMYIPLLIAFALGFSILLREENSFEVFPTSFVTTLIMMTGEIDYEDKFLKESDFTSKLFPFLVLIFFLLLVYIILSNLLVALAVNDLHAIQQKRNLTDKHEGWDTLFREIDCGYKIVREPVYRTKFGLLSFTYYNFRTLEKSEILRLSRQVQLMVTVESFLKSPFIPYCLRKYLVKKFSIFQGYSGGAIAILPNKKYGLVEHLYLKLLFIFRCRPLLTKIFEHFVVNFIPPEVKPSLPNSLIQEAIQIALTELEIEKRDKLLYSKTHQFGSIRQRALLKKQRKISAQNASDVYPLPKRDSLPKNLRFFNPITEDHDIDPFSSYNAHYLGDQQRPSIRASMWRASINNGGF